MRFRAGVVAVLVCAAVVGFWLVSKESVVKANSPRIGTALRVAKPTNSPTPATTNPVSAAPEPSLIAFEGQVVESETGLGIEGADLIFSVGGRNVRQSCDAEGHFVISRQAAQWRLIAITAEGFEPFVAPAEAAPWLEPDPGTRSRPQRFELAKLSLEKARVVDSETRALAGAHVRLAFNALGLERDWPPQVTDKHGDFFLHPFPGDVLQVELNGYETVLTSSNIVARVEDFHDGRRQVIALHRVGSPVMEGLVVDGADAGVAGAAVWAEFAADPDSGFSAHDLLDTSADRSTAVSDLGGRFRLALRRPGLHFLTAHSDSIPGPPGGDLVRTGSSRNLVLRLGLYDLAIEGRVTDSGGAPVSAFTIGIVVYVAHGLAESAEAWSDNKSGRVVPTLSPDGSYRLLLDKGIYGIRISAAGYAAQLRRVTVGPAGLANCDFVLDRGITVTGVVRDRETRAPIGEASLSVEQIDDVGSVSAISNADGTFALEGVQPGFRELTVSTAGRYLLRTIPLPKTGAPVDVDLTKANGSEESEFEGMGIGVAICDGGFAVRSLLPGGGALSAGLQVGDCIVAVDNVRLASIPFAEFLSKGRGPEGTLVHLEVQRASKTFEVNVVRRRIRSR